MVSERLTVGSESDVEQFGGGAEIARCLQCTRYSLGLAVPVHRLCLDGPLFLPTSTSGTSTPLPRLVVLRHPPSPASFVPYVDCSYVGLLSNFLSIENAYKPNVRNGSET